MYDQDLEVFDRDFDVWLRRRSTGEERRLTLDGTADERWVVYRAAPGNAVSPSGRHAVVLRVTETIWEGRRGPFIDLDAILSEWRNPTGEESGILWRPNRHREVRPFLLDIDTRTTIPVAVPSNGRECLNDAGEPHPCFAVFHLVGWLPDGSAFLLGMAEEDAHPGHFPDPHNLHDFRLLSVDPADGSVRTLVAEGPERHITGRSSGWSMGRGAWHLRDRDAFVWPSEMDGWRHLYMLNHDGKQISRITTGAFPVHRVVAVDEREGWVYFTASDDRARPYDIHLYRARFDGSGFTRLTSEPGRHSPGMQAFGVNVGIEMAPSLEYFVDTHSAPDRPPAVDLRRTDGTFVGRLDEANIDRLQTELNWTAPEEFVAKAGDGTTDLYGVLYRPPHFDPSGSYPVVEVIHDLPSGLLVEHAFNVPEKIFDSVFELRGLAEVGFVVVKVDGRGTAYRGRTFSDWSNVHGMTFISEEHAGVLHQLAANRPWMDLERVAVLGVSRGSLQALRAMAQRPDVYRAGVVVSTVAGILSDWAYTPAGVLPLIGDLTGKLMMIQGTRDGGINDVLALGDALSAAGTQYRIVLVSGGGHVMSGDALIYQNETIRDFLQTTFLANDGRPIQ